jgi:peptidoglycan/xylan/chitin deacetylase (PgdA/CDA1 family)
MVTGIPMRRQFLVFSLLFMGVLPRSYALSPIEAVITNGSREQKKVALTFDACPAHDMTVDWGVLNELIETKTPATLFLSGTWMEKFPEATKALAHVPGFELALHSYSHPHMTRLSKEAIAEQLEKNQTILKDLTGISATHFRPPYGEYNDLMVATARSLGLETVEYDLPSGDPARGFKKEKLIANVVKNAKSGSIIVMHMNGRGWHTAEALPEIIQDLKREGMALVTVSELVGESNPSGQHKGYDFFFKRLMKGGSN